MTGKRSSGVSPLLRARICVLRLYDVFDGCLYELHLSLDLAQLLVQLRQLETRRRIERVQQRRHCK